VGKKERKEDIQFVDKKKKKQQGREEIEQQEL